VAGFEDEDDDEDDDEDEAPHEALRGKFGRKSLRQEPVYLRISVSICGSSSQAVHSELTPPLQPLTYNL
jgi:hypothetical protein